MTAIPFFLLSISQVGLYSVFQERMMWLLYFAGPIVTSYAIVSNQTSQTKMQTMYYICDVRICI
jgi:hypothetical protein